MRTSATCTNLVCFNDGALYRVHGFTIRGDTEDPQEKAHKEEANTDAMAFFAKWLGHTAPSNA